MRAFYRLAELARKLETEQEKVLPFYESSQASSSQAAVGGGEGGGGADGAGAGAALAEDAKEVAAALDALKARQLIDS